MRIALNNHNLPSWHLKKRLVNSMKRCFKVSKGHATFFSTFWASKKRLGYSRLSDFLSRRMALRNHYLPSERFKMRLWWCRWSDVSWCRNVIRTHSLHSGHRKKRFGRSRGSDVLSRRMTSLRSGRLKKQLWWCRSDVSCRKATRTHFLYPAIRKKRLGECRLIVVLIRRMTLKTHNWPS
jgi:hypothetical protein